MICVGTSLEDSQRAVAFAKQNPQNCWAIVGIHPHEAMKLTDNQLSRQLKQLADLATDPKVVGIGECGLDFYYNDKKESLSAQEALLRGQIEIAVQHGLPLSFHVREAFEDFWRVFEQYNAVRGVLHSFTDRLNHLEKALDHKLLIGINGIATFTTHSWQRDLFKGLNTDQFVLETDAPFLTPAPKRGTINTPENVTYITECLASLRGESKELLAKATTANAQKLFDLS